MSHSHKPTINCARAFRLILAATDDDEGLDAFGLILDELENCRYCRDAVIVELAYFAANRLQRSPAPGRWDRWLTEYIARLLDAGQEADV
jgi:hypothetical protein